MKKPRRLLVIWNWVPCETTGAGIILRRLLRDYPKNKLWLLTATASARAARGFNPVPHPEHQASVFRFQMPYRFAQTLMALVNVLMIPIIVSKGIQMVRRENLDAVLAVPWDSFFLAAFVIHKFTKVALHVYVMDDPVGNPSVPPYKKPIYSLLMPRILRAAATVWCVSDYTCEEFERLYSVRCRPLWPPVDTEEFRPPGPRAATDSPGRVHIVYTGSIYSAQIDALQNLVKAMNTADASPGGETRFELTLYTDHPEASLQRMGLSGPNIRSRRVTLAQIPQVLAEADVLFLPYTFDARLEHMARTSFPSKIAEYLSAGVPILVHAPPYATATRFCRDQRCGYVVDRPDVGALREALHALSASPQLREELASRGLEVAKQIFERRKIVAEFEEALSS